MATMYINWRRYPTKVVGMTTMQVEGAFISSETIDISAGGISSNAPPGAEYASVWADVPFEFAPGLAPVAVKGSTSEIYPASFPVQVSDVQALATKIAGIAI